MKQLMTIIIALSYLLFASGFTINVHYCMNKVDRISIGHPSNKKCGKCGMHTEESKGCCKDDTKTFKIDDNHKSSIFHFTYWNTAIDIPITHYAFYDAGLLLHSSIIYYNDTSPPLINKDRCVQYCNFRI